MENIDSNPLVKPENFFEGYQKSINELKNDPRLIEMDKLCYELFEVNTQGKRYMELCRERYLIPALVQKGTPTYQLDVLWQEGFKDVFRVILASIDSHKQRILVEANANVGK